MKHRFIADYSHRWPSGAHSAFKRGTVATLKREVIAAAGARGVIEPIEAQP